MNPTVKDFTYHSPLHGTHTCLDYCLTSKTDLQRIMHSEISLRLLTNHNWVNSDFSLDNIEPTEYNWTLNRYLLHSQLLKQDATKAIQTYLEHSRNLDCRESIRWNALKATLRGILISTSTFLKKHRLAAIQTTLSSIGTLERPHKLGVKIPLNLQHLYKLNFASLYSEIKQKLQEMTKQTYSWMERIDIIKSFIAPKFIFLFRTLPLKVPPSDLKLWQQALNNFIWNDKQHRISFRVL